MTNERSIDITCFTDVLCVWAYLSQIKIDELETQFSGNVVVRNRFCSVFGDTQTKFAKGWADRGEFEGYAAHVADVVAKFDHATIHRDCWTTVRPASSLPVHIFLKAIDLATDGTRLDAALKAMRHAFFCEARDIATRKTQLQVSEELGIETGAIEKRLHSGEAFACLSGDLDEAQRQRVEGSPTFVLNNGRQKLYGNVGYRVIEANVSELLRSDSTEQASWC